MIVFHLNEGVHFHKIYLLGGDRTIHPIYDSMQIAFAHHKEDFKDPVTDEQVLSCEDEMELMNLIMHSIIIPSSMKSIAAISLSTPKLASESQSNTEDTLWTFRQNYRETNDFPILIMGTLPYIVRQGLQAKLVMKDYQIDIGGVFHPYLETLQTLLKGELPPAFYLDELHWLLVCMVELSHFYRFKNCRGSNGAQNSQKNINAMQLIC